ncbi:MAG TPA: competence/damage-inducible protein A [Methylomusa anaerophila]|uniref:Putative competence-damage inducible protein n=1 Tax=Methylomusa anaerophila TaxID=1930071 RepID=A0A348APW2_9FIRM|nr:competence/damage-inducible protein A [Methylomusa anaerophila]BBB93110.1 putative competence-damage inducible protein [Methylomusa anaerophila]HML87057.1 competence/damage-inducible protein A [Methylomusa anaerophila]
MIVEIISTGTELLLGQINTDAPYLAKRLNELGYSVLFQSTVGDNRERMSQVIQTALSRSDIVITSGGLGPTQGDITKEVTASVLNLSMYLHEASVERIKRFFAQRHLGMAHSNLRQAMMPEGAIVVDNTCGTAPGVILELANGKVIIHLPGPPRELTVMFDQSVIPYLNRRFGVQGSIVSKVLRTYGLGEPLLEERIHQFILAQGNPTIALLAKGGEIHVRLTAKGESHAEAQKLITDLENKIYPYISDYIFGFDGETLEYITGRLLAAKNFTIALAESCTGGLVSSRLTDIPGSSNYFTGSVVCYSNHIKIEEVGVSAAILEKFGAVSQETALSMAEGIQRKFSADIGIGITGIAGPGGATPNKPVGLVYIAVSGPKGTALHEHFFNGSRLDIKNRTALTALNELRKYLLSL